MYKQMYVCMYVCMSKCMYKQMYVWVCIQILIPDVASLSLLYLYFSSIASYTPLLGASVPTRPFPMHRFPSPPLAIGPLLDAIVASDDQAPICMNIYVWIHTYEYKCV